MSAAHEPTIHYLDSILNEEEKRCDQYSHQWRNFTISRSGRFRSKNKKRDVVDGKLFDGSNSKENEKISARSATSSAISKTNSYATNNATMSGSATTATATTTTTAATSSMRNQRDKMDSYKSFYETNL